MSGHSRWSQIKRQKGVQDAKRGTLFTKLGRAIAVAARAGAQPELNDRLRIVIDQARTANMPHNVIERAIKRGAGELTDGKQIEEVQYEGYGPGGAAVIVQTLTDNRNRTTADLRHLFSKYGGNLSTKNSVAWMFQSRGVITVAANENNEAIVLTAIDAGASDVEEGEQEITIITSPSELHNITDKLIAAGYSIKETAIDLVAKDYINVAETDIKRLEKFFIELNDLDDVDNIFTNANA